MIDTDKYEGHTPAPWRIEYGDMEQYGETDTVLSGIDVVALDVVRQDAQLIADAPLLLEDYKRLREVIEDTYNEIAKGGVSMFPGWKGDRALAGLKELCILIGVYKE